jgi:competence protein ComEC
MLRRPSVFLIGALWTGLAVAGPVQLDLWVVLSALAAALLLMVFTGRPHLAFVMFVVCFFLLGWLRSPEAYWNRHEVPISGSAYDGFPCIVSISGPSPLGKWGEPVKAEVESVLVGYGWLETRCVFLRDPDGDRRACDEGGTARGIFYAPHPRLNPYGWDSALRCRREGVIGTLVVRSWANGSASGPAFLSRFRERLRGLIRAAGSKKTEGVLEALLLGERSDLCPEVKDAMIKAGTYHVIAISGLHVGIVVLLVTSVITTLGPPRALRISLAILCVIAYVVFTGARPSAQRAGALFLVLSLARHLQIKVDSPNCVCAAGIFLLLAFPHLAWNVGFRLSIAAVFGITLLVPQLHRRCRAGGRVAKLVEYVGLGMLASFAAQVSTLPFLLYHFGRVSLMGILSNLIVLPLVTLAVAAGLEGSAAVLIWERLGLVFMKGASVLVAMITAVASFSTQHLDPVVFTGRPPMAKLMVYGCGLGLVGLWGPGIKRRWKLLILVGLSAFLIAPFPRRQKPGMVVTFIHVGDGDACLVELERGGALMIDTGAGGSEHDAGRLDIMPLLAMRGLRRLDTVIITHSHDDHYGGLASLIGNVDIGRVEIGSPTGEVGYTDLLERCREHGIPVGRIVRGDTLTCGGAVLEIFHPSDAYLGDGIEDPNAQSVVLKLVYDTVEFLFTGDVTPEVQQELTGLDFDLACDVLKVPHHGAAGGVDPEFAQRCRARYAVISAGSRFASHPDPGTVSLLEASGARTLVTKRDGAVTVVTDGEGLSVRAEVLGVVGAWSPATSSLDGGDRSWYAAPE